ncbi:hypothetical protein BDV98DRAFT_586743 [Pterulicium gracile]|uniref:F-box domain-containing protein n=1 Tax=Pterulicium gracile TaxID=1884261 RepID=A0A5C3Q4F4_9AGAR|nr:hypothetical protein BDV98DRAFT_586743 [Pterula gracilis]
MTNPTFDRMHQRTLPDELWQETFEFLARSSSGHLVKVCLLSRHLSRIARPILYRNLVLSDKDRPVGVSIARYPLPRAIKLLREDVALARCVRRLTLMSGSYGSSDRSPYLSDAKMLKNLTRLESIDLWGGVFYAMSKSSRTRVVNALYGLPELKILKIDDNSGLEQKHLDKIRDGGREA